jgi:hypothetical protein
MNGVVKAAVNLLRRLGPYAAIELLLPGGSLLAILLWLYRTRVTRGTLACGTLFALSTGSAPRTEILTHLRPTGARARQTQRQLCMKSVNVLMTGTCC